MKKIGNSSLFIVSLVLILIFCSLPAFAKTENVNQESQADINARQDKINKDQADINAKQDKVNKNQADVNENQGNNNQLNGAEHRSMVANFVQGLLDVAGREGGIGEQVRLVAQAQNDTKDQVADEIDKIQNRSEMKTFFIGTDYKNVGLLRSEMVKTGNQIDQLKRLLDQTTDAESKTAFQVQIQALEQEQQKINNFLNANESKFSLFGWFVKLFNK